MLHCIVADGRVECGAATEHISGLETVESLVAAYTPERVAAVCGIPAETIRRLANEFADAEAGAAYGRMGTCVQRFGTLSCWAIDLLNILTGNLDREGGVLFPQPAASLTFAGPSSAEGAPFGRYQSRTGGHDEILGEFPLAAFAEEIETPGEGQIRALAIIAGNPVSSAPNSDRIADALDSLDFMVAFDFYLNETTRHADLIIPPSSPLEHDTYDLALLHFAVHNVAKWSPRAIEPEPGSQPMWQSLIGISKRLMGLAAVDDMQMDGLVLGQFAAAAIAKSPLADEITPEAAAAAVGDEPGPARVLDLLLRIGPYGAGFSDAADDLAPGAEAGLTRARVAAALHGVDLSPLRPSLPAPIATPSGKIELAPERIVSDLSRLDAWLAEPKAYHSFQLIGRRDVRSMNSWLHNLPILAKGKARCTLQINSADASCLGLDDRGYAEVKSRIGSIVAPVEISDRLAPGVVSLPHGWGHDLPGMALRVAARRPGVNTNRVVDDALLDAPSGTSVLNGIPVELSPVSDPG